MRKENVNYLLVGGFVLVMFAAFLALLMSITGRSGPVDEYSVVYRSVEGIKYGTAVLYQGYPVGQVEQVTPERDATGTRYRVDLSVSKGWKIPADSIAEVVASGLLSAITIDIREGSSSEMLSPGDEMRGLEAAGMFDVINDVASDLQALTRHGIRPLVENINKRITSFSDKIEVGTLDIVNDARALTGKLNRSADLIDDILRKENRVHIDRFLADISAVAGNLRDLTVNIEVTRRRIDELFGELNDVTGENREDLRRSLVALRAALETAEQHVSSVSYHVEGTARNMHEFSRQIRENPGLLLGSTPPPASAQGGEKR